MSHRLVAHLTAAAIAVLTAGCDDASHSSQPAPSRTFTQTASPTASTTPTATATVTATVTTSPTPTRDPQRARLGGDTTVFNRSVNAFALPAPNTTAARESDFFVGNSFFNRNWVTAPSSTTGQDGLGPLFNAQSCSSCHFKDGRGAPPESSDDSPVALLFRLGILDADPNAPSHALPAYGDQLQPRAILGVAGEGDVRVSYSEIPGSYADGTPYVLHAPSYEFIDLAYGPFGDGVVVSPRVAPAVFGLGLLAAIPEAAIEAEATAQAIAGIVSGRPNRVWDQRKQATVLGRFGWKANQPSLEQQNAGAFLGDIGMTTDLFPAQNCTEPQLTCQTAPTGGEPEIDANKLQFVTLYTHLLAVPGQRDASDPEVLRGEDLFDTLGCAACHTPTWHTGELADFPEVSQQTIHPFTDLLLHDMGETLADARPDFLASGREWRTPPLWGLGLIPVVNKHQRLLHDGRAHGVAEAILWHGGEAEAARESFRNASADERAALLRFLDSL